MSNILEVKNLSKKYHTLEGEIEAISNVSFNLKDKEFIAIVGSSGCGKSTQVPQFLIDDFKQSKEDDLNIIVCEPRRISCLGLYSRVLAEQGIKASSSCPIGYQVRGDSVYVLFYFCYIE